VAMLGRRRPARRRPARRPGRGTGLTRSRRPRRARRPGQRPGSKKRAQRQKVVDLPARDQRSVLTGIS
jgi:hypothetical protein